MRIEIVAVDKLREPFIKEGCALYIARLRPLMPVSVSEVRVSPSGDGQVREGEAILRKVSTDDLLWAIDMVGKSLSSLEFAKLLDKAQRSGNRKLLLAIGGAKGLSSQVLERADEVVSLSKLTFLHEMARLVVLEQLFRAAKINRREPYHK